MIGTDDTPSRAVAARAGTRGGLRVVYHLFLQDNLIWLVTLYGKDEAADLTASERRLLKAAVDEEKRQRAKRSLPRRK